MRLSFSRARLPGGPSRLNRPDAGMGENPDYKMGAIPRHLQSRCGFYFALT